MARRKGGRRRAIRHVGFKGAVASVQRQGKSKAAAQRIIGAGKARASAAAKARNPRLKRKGGRRKSSGGRRGY